MAKQTSLFPDNFNLRDSEKLLNQKVRESKEIADAVAYVQRCMAVYLGKNKEYFVVNLQKYAPLIRLAVMVELLTNFKYIGKPVADKNDLFLQLGSISPLFSPPGSFMPQVPKPTTYKVSVIKEFNENDYKYIIALTENFGKNMNGMAWA